MSSMKKQDRFLDLVRRVQNCRRCPRMSDSARVLGPGCGPITAKLMFVGEAPGRLGADASQLPFHGDRSGHNFESLLEQVGLSRYDAFVTNCVLCNPKSADGKNATPTAQEIANCSPFLKEQIELINPDIVVTLGAVALRAVDLLDHHSISMREGVRKVHNWSGRKLIPAYHPGARAMASRSFANQLSDYQFIAENVRRTKNPRRKPSTSVNRRTQRIGVVAGTIVEHQKELTYFALHKMLFLAEVRHLEKFGRRLSGAYIIRQKDGPYCVELNLARLRALMPGIHVVPSSRGLVVRAATQVSLFAGGNDEKNLNAEELRSIEDCVARYGTMSDSQIKTAAYMTRPMREILRREKRERINLFNAPILPPE